MADSSSNGRNKSARPDDSSNEQMMITEDTLDRQPLGISERSASNVTEEELQQIEHTGDRSRFESTDIENQLTTAKETSSNQGSPETYGRQSPDESVDQRHGSRPTIPAPETPRHTESRLSGIFARPPTTTFKTRKDFLNQLFKGPRHPNRVPDPRRNADCDLIPWQEPLPRSLSVSERWKMVDRIYDVIERRSASRGETVGNSRLTARQQSVRSSSEPAYNDDLLTLLQQAAGEENGEESIHKSLNEEAEICHARKSLDAVSNPDDIGIPTSKASQQEKATVVTIRELDDSHESQDEDEDIDEAVLVGETGGLKDMVEMLLKGVPKLSGPDWQLADIIATAMRNMQRGTSEHKTIEILNAIATSILLSGEDDSDAMETIGHYMRSTNKWYARQRSSFKQLRENAPPPSPRPRSMEIPPSNSMAPPQTPRPRSMEFSASSPMVLPPSPRPGSQELSQDNLLAPPSSPKPEARTPSQSRQIDDVTATSLAEQIGLAFQEKNMASESASNTGSYESYENEKAESEIFMLKHMTTQFTNDIAFLKYDWNKRHAERVDAWYQFQVAILRQRFSGHPIKPWEHKDRFENRDYTGLHSITAAVIQNYWYQLARLHQDKERLLDENKELSDFITLRDMVEASNIRPVYSIPMSATTGRELLRPYHLDHNFYRVQKRQRLEHRLSVSIPNSPNLRPVNVQELVENNRSHRDSRASAPLLSDDSDVTAIDLNGSTESRTISRIRVLSGSATDHGHVNKKSKIMFPQSLKESPDEKTEQSKAGFTSTSAPESTISLPIEHNTELSADELDPIVAPRATYNGQEIISTRGTAGIQPRFRSLRFPAHLYQDRLRMVKDLDRKGEDVPNPQPFDIKVLNLIEQVKEPVSETEAAMYASIGTALFGPAIQYASRAEKMKTMICTYVHLVRQLRKERDARKRAIQALDALKETMNQLETRIRYQQGNNTLSTELSTMDDRLEVATAQIERLEDQRDGLEDQMNDLEEERDDLVAERDNLEAIRDKLTRQLKQAQEEVKIYQVELIGLNNGEDLKNDDGGAQSMPSARQPQAHTNVGPMRDSDAPDLPTQAAEFLPNTEESKEQTAPVFQQSPAPQTDSEPIPSPPTPSRPPRTDSELMPPPSKALGKL